MIRVYKSPTTRFVYIGRVAEGPAEDFEMQRNGDLFTIFRTLSEEYEVRDVSYTELIDGDYQPFADANACALYLSETLTPETYLNTNNLSFFINRLVDKEGYEAADVLSTIELTAEAPTVAPAITNLPAFRVVPGAVGDKLYYWDYLGQTGWLETSYPWANPIQSPEFIIEPLTTIGTGSSNWTFSMGPEIRINEAGDGKRITRIGFKTNTIGLRTWDLRRSTTVGAAQPVLTTYTDVIESGQVNVTSANTWTYITLSSPHVVAEDEYYIANFFIGTGGQSFNIATVRTAGQLNEDYATLVAGTYRSVGGTFPGTVGVPTTRSTTICYGIATIEISP